MRTQLERIKKDIEKLAEFNSTPGEGMTRFSFTPEDRLARDYIISEMKAAGLSVRVDPVGNIFGRWDGLDASATPVMAGSHLDSVPHGGIFDGPAGVVTALEAVRVITESEERFKRPIDVIVFAEEEGGGRFRAGLFGSLALTGQIKKDMLDKIVDADGITIKQAMADFGLEPDKVEEAAMKPDSIYALIELHIEQGPVLEENQNALGIVDAIAGIEEGTVKLVGISGHAGAIPMKLRHDPMAATANIIVRLNEIVATQGSAAAVGTVGLVKPYPNAINIIPESVVFTYDLRDTSNKHHQQALDFLKEAISLIAEEFGVEHSITVNLYSPAVTMSEKIKTMMQDSAKKMGIPVQNIVSGAGHDAMVMHRVSEHVAMIFARSKGGHSHRPDEWTSFEDLQAGSELILETITKLAAE